MNQTSLKYKHILYYDIELAARTFKSTNNIKIKKTPHRLMEDAYICEVISVPFMNARWVSQSVFYQVLNAVSDGVFKGNV